MAKEQFHDSTDSLVQSQLKGINPRKHYTCLHWRPFISHITLEKHTGEAVQCWEDCNKRKGENKKLVYCTESDKNMKQNKK